MAAGSMQQKQDMHFCLFSNVVEGEEGSTFKRAKMFDSENILALAKW